VKDSKKMRHSRRVKEKGDSMETFKSITVLEINRNSNTYWCC
jgi:hypothetical protein